MFKHLLHYGYKGLFRAAVMGTFLLPQKKLILLIPNFQNFKFVRVSSLVGRYFYNMYMFIHVNIILGFPITYRNASVLCQSECACLHKTVNMVVFYVKSNENTYPKGFL